MPTPGNTPLPAPDLRGWLPKFLDAVLHRVKGKHEDRCEHCHHVAEMRVKVRVLFLIFTGVATMMFRDAITQLSARVHIDPTPSNSAERMGSDRAVKRDGGS